MKLLKEIRLGNNLWSVVYNLTTGEFQVVMGFNGEYRRMNQPNLSQIKKFNLKMKK